ncbi:hypothetical protein ACIQI8_41805 [Streptomyces sp. NPDC092369]|uniref:hypothetical protein n=1 Tax=Streptomyces sp. NPDC092369 TaxID=3366015 RepID=UPI0037F6A9BE
MVLSLHLRFQRKAVDVVLVDQRARRVGAIAGAAVAAIVGLSGCSDDPESGEGQKQPVSSSPVNDKSKSPEAGSAAASGVDRSSAEKAITGRVAALIKGDVEEACLLMAEPADGSRPAQVGSAKTCGDDAPERGRMKATLGQLKESFTSDPPSTDPKVEVTQALGAADKVTVPAAEINVDGQALDKIVLSHSTGVTQDQLDIKVESSKIEDSWYVTNLDFNVG